MYQRRQQEPVIPCFFFYCKQKHRKTSIALQSPFFVLSHLCCHDKQLCDAKLLRQKKLYILQTLIRTLHIRFFLFYYAELASRVSTGITASLFGIQVPYNQYQLKDTLNPLYACGKAIESKTYFFILEVGILEIIRILGYQKY